MAYTSLIAFAAADAPRRAIDEALAAVDENVRSAVAGEIRRISRRRDFVILVDDGPRTLVDAAWVALNALSVTAATGRRRAPRFVCHQVHS
jgi:hypothetical protein